MANVSITNPTISNSETSDVTKLTQNDNDLCNGITDGSKDITVSSVITNTISERTAASGVTVDGLLIKDGCARNTTQYTALATTVSSASDIAAATVIEIIVAATGTYEIHGMAYTDGVTDEAFIKTGSATYGSATQKAYAKTNDAVASYHNLKVFAVVALTAGNSVHLGVAVAAAGGTRNIYGNTTTTGCTALLVRQVA